jgi:molybdopterin converting factor small subunit
MITVTVLLFGHYRDALPPNGSAPLMLADGATAADAAAALAERDSRLGDLLRRTRVAVRAEFAATDTVLTDGDEVAFLPPMSGG